MDLGVAEGPPGGRRQLGGAIDGEQAYAEPGHDEVLHEVEAVGAVGDLVASKSGERREKANELCLVGAVARVDNPRRRSRPPASVLPREGRRRSAK